MIVVVAVDIIIMLLYFTNANADHKPAKYRQHVEYNDFMNRLNMYRLCSHLQNITYTLVVCFYSFDKHLFATLAYQMSHSRTTKSEYIIKCI